jgi:hypothetical protein
VILNRVAGIERTIDKKNEKGIGKSHLFVETQTRRKRPI